MPAALARVTTQTIVCHEKIVLIVNIVLYCTFSQVYGAANTIRMTRESLHAAGCWSFGSFPEVKTQEDARIPLHDCFPNFVHVKYQPIKSEEFVDWKSNKSVYSDEQTS